MLFYLLITTNQSQFYVHALLYVGLSYTSHLKGFAVTQSLCTFTKRLFYRFDASKKSSECGSPLVLLKLLVLSAFCNNADRVLINAEPFAC